LLRLAPSAAAKQKRLATLLEGVVKEYEKRFGTLSTESPAQ